VAAPAYHHLEDQLRALLIGVAALALTGCASVSATHPAATHKASTPPASTPSDTPTDTAPAHQGVGAAFDITAGNDTYTVRLVKVLQHAAPSDSFENAPHGKHLAGAEFVITGQAGHTNDNANNNAIAVGSDDQDYESAFDTLAAGTNFSSGDFRVSAGEHVRGWVSFEIPNGVRVAAIQWAPNSGLSDSAATWDVTGS
jgi:hypothetical protein